VSGMRGPSTVRGERTVFCLLACIMPSL
jgi:hypothetical protein